MLAVNKAVCKFTGGFCYSLKSRIKAPERAVAK